MKVVLTALTTTLFICFVGFLMFMYSIADRVITVNYDSVDKANYQNVLCIDEYGNAKSYNILIPDIEGFVPQDREALELSFKKDFCSSIGD